MNIQETLRGVIDLVDSDDKWTDGAYARNKVEQEVDPLDEEAKSWCTLGAVQRVRPWDTWLANAETKDVLSYIADHIPRPDWGIVAWQDDSHLSYEDWRLTMKQCLVDAEDEGV